MFRRFQSDTHLNWIDFACDESWLWLRIVGDLKKNFKTIEDWGIAYQNQFGWIIKYVKWFLNSLLLASLCRCDILGYRNVNHWVLYLNLDLTIEFGILWWVQRNFHWKYQHKFRSLLLRKCCKSASKANQQFILLFFYRDQERYKKW